MIHVKEIYDSVAYDYANSQENGQLSFGMFNRMSKLAEFRLMDFLTGDVSNVKPPTPYTSQKLKDWLNPFITPYSKNVSATGDLILPDDYYRWESSSATGAIIASCDKDGVSNNVPVTLLDSGEFSKRIVSNILGLQPNYEYPIAKMVGGKLVFAPKDIGGVTIEYIRKPKIAQIVSKVDTEYNDLVIDEAASTNYEYGEWAMELLVYFIGERFAMSNRETDLVQHEQIMGKLVREGK